MSYEELLDRADRAFTAAAVDEALIDVATTTVDTPIGTLLLAATDQGIARVAFEVEGFDTVLTQVAAAISLRILELRTPLLARAAEQLDAYFASAAHAFDLPLDLRLARGPYRREVLGLLATIPAGQTRSYRDIAIQSGRPGAVRAVGSGCATNPVPVIVPCHRVLRTGGDLGGYLGGVERKRWLLEHERAVA